MGQIDTIKDISGTEPIYSKAFYNNVFKKTEKIVSAVFFILNRHEAMSHMHERDILSEQIKNVSIEVLNLISESLLHTESALRTNLLVLTQKLLLLNGYITVAVSSELIAQAYGSIISSEVSSLISAVADYSNSTDRGGAARISTREIDIFETRRSAVAPKRQTQRTSEVKDNTLSPIIKDRKEAIAEILKEKGQVSIKDISDVIKNVSEKSIQRDLQAMIEKGQVIRQGERRWSVYSLV